MYLDKVFFNVSKNLVSFSWFRVLNFVIAWSILFSSMLNTSCISLNISSCLPFKFPFSIKAFVNSINSDFAPYHFNLLRLMDYLIKMGLIF